MVVSMGNKWEVAFTHLVKPMAGGKKGSAIDSNKTSSVHYL